MTLSFTKEKNLYVAEFVATNSFNLRFDAVGNGQLVLYSSNTSDGEKLYWKSYRFEYFFDKDVADSVFPKYVRVISTCEILSATITFDTSGEGGGGGGSSDDYANVIQEINSIKNDIAAMRGDNDTTQAIDTMKEVSDFLEGYEKGEKLADSEKWAEL